MSSEIILRSIDIDSIDAFQSCAVPGCREYASYRVVKPGESVRRMCYAHAHAEQTAARGSDLPRQADRCDHCDRLVEADAGRCPRCGAGTRRVPVDAEGKPIWLADGGWYD
jgi:uncharacterized paraquat-inducible protein A